MEQAAFERLFRLQFACRLSDTNTGRYRVSVFWEQPPTIAAMTSNSNAIQAAPTNVHALMRVPAAIDARGIQKSQHYKDVQDGLFTPPVKIGKHASAYPCSEVAALNSARIAGKTDDEIRLLVQQLVAARAALA